MELIQMENFNYKGIIIDTCWSTFLKFWNKVKLEIITEYELKWQPNIKFIYTVLA